MSLSANNPATRKTAADIPFVGPAGLLFDRALEVAAIDRAAIYVTNAVKHFKFEERGERRIHKKPAASEVNTCHPWLEAEIEVIRPRVTVCLGATAAGAIFGRNYLVTKERGLFVTHAWAPSATPTIHSSAILRAPDGAQRQLEFEKFVDDLKKVRSRVFGSGTSTGQQLP